MSDFEDRLAALDPAAHQPYQHQNLESMIARVTRMPATSKRRVWRNFQLKFAGAVVTSALLTTGAIATFSNGPSFAVLAITGTHNVPTPLSSAPPFSSAMQTLEEFNFSAGSGLSATTPSSPSYALQIPSSASSEASRVATIFGVNGRAVNSGSDLIVRDAAGNTLVYRNVGVPQWNFVSASSGAVKNSEAAALSVLPDHSAVDALVKTYVSKLGYGFSLSTPTFGTSTSGTLNPDGSVKTSVGVIDVNYTVLINSVNTDQSISFSVDSNDEVVAASGPAFTLGSPQNYPLESPQAGISALNTVQVSKFPNNATASTTQTSANGSSAAAPTVPSIPPIVDVTLNSLSLSLKTYQLADGSTWLLPVYSYAGEAANSYGTSSSSTWNELAIDPSYVSVSAASPSGVTHGPVNY